MIGCDLWFGGGKHGKDRAFTYGRQSDKPGIGNGLKFQLHLPLLGFYTILCKSRSLMSRGSIASVAFAPPATFQNGSLFICLEHIRQNGPGLHVPHYCTYRHGDNKCFSVLAPLHFSLSLLPVFRPIKALIAKLQQGILTRIRPEHQIPAVASVTTGRAALHNKLFPMKGRTAIAAAAGFYHNTYLIQKLHVYLLFPVSRRYFLLL